MGQKPGVLRHLGEIDRKTWDRYRAHLERTSPLERAETYARQMELRKLRSTAALERLLGEPPLRVWRALRLLELPEPVRQFLKDHPTPHVLRYFTERKLLGLLKLGDARRIWVRFQQMVAEAQREAGIWQGATEPPAPEGSSR